MSIRPETDGAQKMAAGLERLRLSKQKMIRERDQLGMEDATKWTLMTAKADELDCLARCPDAPAFTTGFMDDEGDAYTPAERFVFAIRPDTVGDRQAAAEFWTTIDERFETNPPCGHYVGAFARTALSIWWDANV
jgi:hypothetical protein